MHLPLLLVCLQVVRAESLCNAEALCARQDQQRGTLDGPRGTRAQAVLHAGIHAARLRHERGARGAPKQRTQPQRVVQATGGRLTAHVYTTHALH